MAKQYIKIRGANEHNLKNIDLDIPRNELVVLTGLSGSGKSSLAFDTIYAEGQRRYMESLSSYARQFLGQMEKPNVESIEGLSPAISIDQKSTNRNPRSTVGTVTEIYDYFRLLYARIGIPHCPKCGKEIKKQTVDQMVDQIMELPEGTKIQLLAPVVRGRKGRHEKLLEIPGVMISDVEVREYPLGEAAAHLVGYVQSVTAEDLEEHAGEGYTANSVIGRSGMEGLFESELKGQNGCRIYIVNSEGKEKEELACILVQHGQDIQLTIDTDLQVSLYEQFKEDKSCSVAMNPYTGEVLALVSTPAYDNNDFIMGLSSEQWTALNEDENKPMYNRFRQVWCPGSTFKPITAAVGLESGAIDPMEDYGNVGLSWQKDASWGSYHVTTLHAYEPVILENALIYSDNIYFAKAALKIGSEEMESSLTGLGFNEELPFEIKMAESQYSNSEGIETEIQLADSGYGQGQVLVNPLHMACIYSAFCNEGNVIKPYLVYQNEATAEYWIPGAFSNETASRVLEGTKKVVNDSNGTGYAAHRDDILLAGKTGTAEIKASKDDTSGTELGWFAIFTAEDTVERPILIISMVEDVKGRGGSGYVVKKDGLVLEEWFSSN